MAVDIHNSRILITGASGQLGKQLIYEFNLRGIKPIAHVRETSDTTYIDSLGLEKRQADLRQQESLEKLVDGVDLVIHTAAWVNFRQDRLTQFTGINVFGAVNMYKAAASAGVKRFLHMSTAAAVGAVNRRQNGGQPPEDLLVREDSQFNLGGLRIPYIMTKRAAEEELKKVAADSRTELVLVNPTIIVGPSRTGDDHGKARRLFNRFVMPDLPVRVNLVDIRDVAPAVITALHEGRHGERYILAGDNITVKELVLAVSSIVGRVPHVLRIPRPVYNFAARASLAFSKILGRGRVSFYPDLVKLIDYDWAYSYSKAREELGFKCRSIHTTLDDLLSHTFLGTYLKPAVESRSPK